MVKDKLESRNNIPSSIEEVLQTVSESTEQVKGSLLKTKNSIIKSIDINGNGEIDIEDFIILGLRSPGININRADFLQTELTKYLPQEVIDIAILSNPLQANIPSHLIDHIADEVIKYERNCVSGISTALGMPGGFTMMATIPADIVQYYGYMLRAAQKLMYLYGFPEIDTYEKGQKFDSETINILIICLGTMYGVSGANAALKTMAAALGRGVEKQLLNKALTKGTIYPIVKSVAKWFGIKMTKQTFAQFFKKAIPVVGGVVGGGITYISFKPCCDKLKDSLRNTYLSNPDYKVDESTEEELSSIFETK